MLTKWSDEYPLVMHLIVIMLLIPCDTSECERVFSLMNDFKSAERNSLGATNLKNLMIWHSIAKKISHVDLPGHPRGVPADGRAKRPQRPSPHSAAHAQLHRQGGGGRGSRSATACGAWPCACLGAEAALAADQWPRGHRLEATTSGARTTAVKGPPVAGRVRGISN